MATRKIVPQIDGINNIIFPKVYDKTKISQTFSENNGSYKIDADLGSNVITNNTISPPKSTNPNSYHPHLLNRHYLINSSINNGYYVPYLSYYYNLFENKDTIEIYYTYLEGDFNPYD